MLGAVDTRIVVETAWRLATLGRAYDAARLPAVLAQLEPRTIAYARTWQEIDRVRRLSAVVVYHLPIASSFGACLKLALVRYALLRRRGLPVTFHLGLRVEREGLLGHAWLSLHGRPLWERQDPSAYRETFRFPR